MDDPEEIWSALLSQEPGKIRRAWLALTDDEATAVLAHLSRMRDESGWADAQQSAAATALHVIQSLAQ